MGGGTERGEPSAPSRTMQAPQRSEERSESRMGERLGAFILSATTTIELLSGQRSPNGFVASERRQSYPSSTRNGGMSENVLLLLTDQERYDVSHPDGPPVETPAMDRLRREGVAFERAYTPIGICSGARASLLTGLYPHNHGMLNNCHEADAVLPDLPPDLLTFGDLLADAGYDNSYLGKWHVGRDQGPADFGFERLDGADAERADEEFRAHQREHGVDPDGIELEDTIERPRGHPPIIAGRTPVPEEATYTYYLTERTIERLEALADGRDGARRDGGTGTGDDGDESPGDTPGPFFHRTDFPGPHPPYVVPEPYASMYDPDELELWDNHRETYAGKPAVQERYLSYRGVDELTRAEWRELLAKCFGFVSFVDAQMGRILDALDGLELDPMVVHAADHGDFAGGHRQYNKGPFMYEETYHVPLIVRWSGVEDPGSTREKFVRLHDLMPTFLDVAGVDPPADLDARSLVPLLRGESPDDWPDAAFAEYHGDEFGLYSQRMVRTGQYKYVYNPPDTDELYDLAADPGELENLVDHPMYADVAARLRRRLHEWMGETDDVIEQASRHVLLE